MTREKIENLYRMEAFYTLKTTCFELLAERDALLNVERENKKMREALLLAKKWIESELYGEYSSSWSEALEDGVNDFKKIDEALSPETGPADQGGRR